MRRYLDTMLAQNRVRVVEREVSGRHELAAVTQRSQRESDAPLLFRRVAGTRYPVMTNIFGSRPRLTGDARRRAEFLPPLGGADGNARRAAGRRGRAGRVGRSPPDRRCRRSPISSAMPAPISPPAFFWPTSRTAACRISRFTARRSSATRELRIRLGSPHHLTAISGESGSARRSAGSRDPARATARHWCSRPPRRSLTTRASWRSPAASPDGRCAMRRCRTIALVGASRHRNRHRRPDPAAHAPSRRPVRRVHGLLRSGRRQPRVRSDRRHRPARRDLPRADLRLAGGSAPARAFGRDARLPGAARRQPARHHRRRLRAQRDEHGGADRADVRGPCQTGDADRDGRQPRLEQDACSWSTKTSTSTTSTTSGGPT